jgi:hypothetical protein
MFRGRSWIPRACIVFLLLASVGTGVVALPHADGDRDAACSPVAVAHDETAHSIHARQRATGDEPAHCFLCHSLRTFFQPFDRFHQPHHLPRTERLHFSTTDRASAVAWTLVPGRAPPV